MKQPERKGPGRPPGGKYRNPEYEQTTVFLRKDTKRRAQHFLLDDPRDFDLSDLIEHLLSKQVAGKSRGN